MVYCGIYVSDYINQKITACQVGPSGSILPHKAVSHWKPDLSPSGSILAHEECHIENQTKFMSYGKLQGPIPWGLI